MAGPERRLGAIGPLGVNWLSWTVAPLRAGAPSRVAVTAENVGSVTWHPDGDRGIYASYHWLDLQGNPIVWGGIFSHLPHAVPPGGRAELDVAVAAPIPPGRYRLAVDLVAEGRCWFAELGNSPLELDCDVLPRLRERALAIRIQPGRAERLAETRAAIGGQEELVTEGDAAAVAHLTPGCLPAPDWSRRILDAHEEGFTAVGGSVEPVGSWRARRRARVELAAWAPGGGRNPAFAERLLCPSLVAGFEPVWVDDVHGLPAIDPPEPRLFDGRIALRFRAE